VMVAWFAVLAFLGLRQIFENPAVLLALNPMFAIKFIVAQKTHAFVVLGSVVLVVTGGEALYADLGHFGPRSIRAAWFGLTMPALLLNYFGQGALLIRDPTVSANPFFSMVSQGRWTYALVVLSAAATVIASQALISGVFSLTQQAVQLGFFPRVTITHTSGDTEGQIYVPGMNWALAVVCIALVLAFGRSSRLAAAYGLAVTGTMVITSLIYFEVTRVTWRWPPWKAGAILVLFLSLDLLFFGSTLSKFRDGGFVPILIGLCFFVVMSTWHEGRRIYRAYLASLSPRLDQFLAEGAGRTATRISGSAVFVVGQGSSVPSVLVNLVKRFRVIPETVVLLTIKVAHVPHAASGDVRSESLGDGFFRLIVEYGFMDVPDVPAALETGIKQGHLPIHAGEVTYYLGRDTFVATSAGRMGRLSESLFAFLARNARSVTDHYRIPPQQVVEIGSRIDL
jgi:KUP system potassium uptake protein